MKKVPSRAPRREPLTRDRVLDAALSIIDSEGLPAISMRRLGEALGVEAMSLYNHVPNKAAVLDGVFERILAELPPARKRSTWQASLRARALELARVLRAHPNALPLFATRPAVTPAAFEHLEWALSVLHEEGFSPEAALGAFQVMVALVVGHTLQAFSPVPADELSHPAYAELDADRFPRVRQLALLLPERDVERELAMGVDALLIGLDASRGAREGA